MTETNSNRTNTVLVILIILLITATAVQGFFLFKIYRGKQNSDHANDPSTTRLVSKQPENQSSAGTPRLFGGLGSDTDNVWWSRNMDNWNPFSEVQRMQQQMNRLFDESFGRFRLTPEFADKSLELSFSPRLDLKEKRDRYVVSMDIPGAEKSNISVSVDDRQLKIIGQIDETVEEKEGNDILRKERRSGQFQRSIMLPGPVDAEDMTAEYNGGVLTVTIPKGKETAQSRTITIK